MSNCVFAYPDLTLTATLSGAGSGTWTGLDNLKNPLRSKVAYTANPNNIAIRGYLGVSKQVGAVALIGHNATIAATYRIRLYTSSSYAEAALIPGSDSGVKKFWPDPWYPSGAAITSDEAAQYTLVPDAVHVYSANIVNAVSPYGVYIQVEITDTANSNFQLGRLFVARKRSPESTNLLWGAGFTWKEDVLADTTPSGVTWMESLSRGREISGRFSTLDDTDSQLVVMERQMMLGRSGELYFVMDPAGATGLLQTRAMLCRFKDENPLLIAAYGDHGFTLEEIR
jgi:hypothetical protein